VKEPKKSLWSDPKERRVAIIIIVGFIVSIAVLLVSFHYLS